MGELVRMIDDRQDGSPRRCRAYMDILLTWSDINAARMSFDRGIAMYKVWANVGVTNDWLIREVIPAIMSAFGVSVNLLHSKALLLACLIQVLLTP